MIRVGNIISVGFEPSTGALLYVGGNRVLGVRDPMTLTAGPRNPPRNPPPPNPRPPASMGPSSPAEWTPGITAESAPASAPQQRPIHIEKQPMATESQPARSNMMLFHGWW
jgi:hypothetical protein